MFISIHIKNILTNLSTKKKENNILTNLTCIRRSFLIYSGVG